MGYNTVAVLYNDFSSEIHQDNPRVYSAMFSDDRQGAAAKSFGWGFVVSSAHADDTQVVVVGRNGGNRVSEFQRAGIDDLEALADVLMAHGYGVRGPNEKRIRPAPRWGYAAEQNKVRT